jgi:hypothetical protein
MSHGGGDGEAGSEDGVTLDAYFHVLPDMQQRAVNSITEVLKEEWQSVANSVNQAIILSRQLNNHQEWRGGLRPNETPGNLV